MSAFVFGAPVTVPSVASRTSSSFTYNPLTQVGPVSLSNDVPSRNLSMNMMNRRGRGGSLWGPRPVLGDLMFPERMMSRFFEPFNDIVSFMGDDGLVEEENQYKVKMMMPGISKEDIKVDVKNGILNIRVERKMEEENKNEETGQVEWVRKQMSKVNRSWRMPENADLDNISAVTKDGILCVTVPKTEKAEPSKTIDVQGE